MPFWTSWGSHVKGEVFGSRASPGKTQNSVAMRLGGQRRGKGGGTGSRGPQSTGIKLNGIVTLM